MSSSLPAVIRRATEADGPALAAIYAPYVENTTFTFEEVPPDGTEMASRLAAAGDRFPWLIAESDGAGLGYAVSSRHRTRPAYRWSVEVGVYIHEKAHRRGLGERLYRTLLELLTGQGFVSAYAGITQPNPSSLAFHQALGFTEVGTFRAAGFKLGQWCDVLWMQRQLQDLSPHPREPGPAPALIPPG